MRRTSKTVTTAVLLLLTAATFAGLLPTASAASANLWESPRSLEGEPLNASQVRTAVLPDGHVCAAWVQSTGAASQYIAAAVFDPGVGWGSYYNLSIGSAGTSARVAAVGTDRFLVAWIGANNVSVNWFTVGSGWSGPASAYEAGAAVQSLSVAGDAAGRAALAWTVNTGFSTRVQASLFNASNGWTVPTQMGSLTNVNAAAVALGPGGNALVAWRENNGGGGTASRISAALYVSGWGWGGSSALTGNFPNTNFTDLWPAVAMAANGNAVMVGRAQLGTPFVANRYVAGSGWQGLVTLAPLYGGYAANQPTVDMDDAGNAIVPVTELTAVGTPAAEIFQMTAAGAWSQRNAPGSAQPSGNTAAALDHDGRAMVAWTEDLGSGYVARAVRYLPTSGWGAPQDFSAGNGSQVVQGRTAVDLGANGDGGFVWIDNSTGPQDVFGAAFARDSVAPTLDVTYPTDGPTVYTDITVTGTTDIDATVTVDGVPVSVDGGTGAFSRLVSLAEGPHTFVVVATDAEGNTATSSIAVVVDNTAPLLSLTDPVDGSNVSAPFTLVSGRTEPGAVVEINGVAVEVSPTGSFSAIIALHEGQNLVRVEAWDAVNNKAQVERGVTYTMPPVEGLAEAQAALAAANLSLANSTAALAAAQAQVAAANQTAADALADANAAEAALIEARADANASAADLTQAEARYNSAVANLTAAQGQVTASSAALTTAQSALTAAQAAYTAASTQASSLSQRLNETQADLADANAAAADARADAATAQSAAQGASTAAMGGILLGVLGMVLAIAAMRRAGRAPHDHEEPKGAPRDGDDGPRGSKK